MMGEETYMVFTVAEAFMIFFFIAIGVLVILWIALPFSVFGIKDLIKETIKEQRRTNELLASLVERIKDKTDKESHENAVKAENIGDEDQKG